MVETVLSDGSGFYTDGSISCLLTVPHATPPESEPCLKEIAMEVSKLTGAHALIGGISRKKLDLNRKESEGTDFRKRIWELKSDGLKLILDLHGKEGKGMEIGTARGRSASEGTVQVLKALLKKCGFDVKVNARLTGSMAGTITSTYAGQGLEVVQLEIGPTERKRSRDAIIAALAEFIGNYEPI